MWNIKPFVDSRQVFVSFVFVSTYWMNFDECFYTFPTYKYGLFHFVIT
jgi:hypothetical protein